MATQTNLAQPTLVLRRVLDALTDAEPLPSRRPRVRSVVGTIRKATNVLTDRSYFQKVKVGRNIEFVVASRPETGNGTLNS
jgi:hypothetical protein